MFDIERELNKIKLEFNKKSNRIAELINNNFKNVKVNESFSYKIDRKTFIDAIDALKDLHEWIDKASDIGINLDENDAILNIESTVVDLLCKCCNDNGDDIPAICYFLYDLNSGEYFRPGDPWLNDEDDVSTPSALWNYLQKYNMNKGNEE